MSLSEQFSTDELHPIDIVEHLAEHHDWDFDRVAEDQIAMAVEGQWRTYSITLAWSPADETLRLICTFEMEPPATACPELYETLNRANDLCWAGAFTWWGEQSLMVYRYGLVLAGGQMASARADRHDDRRRGPVGRTVLPGVPARRLERPDAAQAMQVAIAEAYGRA
jgi:hypothetical protein